MTRIDRVLLRLLADAEGDIEGGPIHSVIVREAQRQLPDVPRQKIAERLETLTH